MGRSQHSSMQRCWAALLLASALLAAAAATAGATADTPAEVSCKDAPKTAKCGMIGPDVAMWWWVSEPSKTLTAKVVTAGEWGWIGLGLSESGGMRAADIAIVTLGGDNGTAAVEDTYSVKYGMPQRDEKQSWQLLEASVGGGRTQVKLRRKLDPCDDQDIEVLQGQNHFVIWARGNDWPEHHSEENVGSAQLLLWPLNKKQRDAVEAVVADLPPNYPEALNDTGVEAVVRTVDVQFPADYQVPVMVDEYMCQAYQLPPDVMHITSFLALLPEEPSRSNVHHILVYGCSSPPTQNYTTEPKACGGVPEFTCSRMLAGWAPGKQDGSGVLPGEAGLLVGNTTGGLEWVVLQVHYSNPELAAGRNGSVGMRMEMTSKLRPYEMGTLILGQLSFNIPPGETNYAIAPAWCPSGCTKRFDHPLRIVGIQFHQHQAGREISTRIFRGGKELQPLGHKMAYDFTHQSFVDPPPGVQFLLPGDELLTQCTYSTTDRTKSTKLGEDTASEMCFTFITYYPRVPEIETCLSTGKMNEQLRPLLPALGIPSEGEYDTYTCSTVQSLSGRITPQKAVQAFQSGALGLTNSTRDYPSWEDPHCKAPAGRKLKGV